MELALCDQPAPTRRCLTSLSRAGLMRCWRWKSLRTCCWTVSVIPLKGGWRGGVVAESILQERRKGNLCTMSFPGSSDGKESACNVGDLGLISGLGRSPGEGNGYPLHYSCLENPMDRGAWWATGHGVAKSQTRLSDKHMLTRPRVGQRKSLGAWEDSSWALVPPSEPPGWRGAGV